jgi:hypothetical protein
VLLPPLVAAPLAASPRGVSPPYIMYPLLINTCIQFHRNPSPLTRTLLIHASLPGRYWAKGLHTVVYLLNRLPTKTISAAYPHVALFGSAPSYEHFRVFGCAPHKLSPWSTRCVFLGYSADHKGYCCLDLSTNRLIVSRHVVF